MKNLEIINKRIEELEEYLKLKDDFPISEFRDQTFDRILKELSYFRQVKADLEVLEIIREKKVNVGWLMFLMKDYMKLEDIEKIYPKDGDTPLTIEELLKLKQWLEGNE